MIAYYYLFGTPYETIKDLCCRYSDNLLPFKSVTILSSHSPRGGGGNGGDIIWRGNCTAKLFEHGLNSPWRYKTGGRGWNLFRFLRAVVIMKLLAFLSAVRESG